MRVFMILQNPIVRFHDNARFHDAFAHDNTTFHYALFHGSARFHHACVHTGFHYAFFMIMQTSTLRFAW